MPSRVLDIVKRAGVQNNPNRALQELIEDCITQTGADTGRLFLLNLATTAYVQSVPSDGFSANPPSISLLAQRKETNDMLLRTSIAKLKVMRVPQLSEQPMARGDILQAQSRLLVPIVRDRVCLGVIDLDSQRANYFTQTHEDMIKVAAVIALLLCEKEDTLNLLNQLPTPIDYHQNIESFLEELMFLIAAASGMPLIALRELRDDTLYCIKSYGFDDRSADELHLTPLDAYPTFLQAIETRQTVIERHIEHEHVRRFLETLKLHRVKSFIVVPLIVGTAVIGTLSFAVSCEHEYTELERSGLETIANSVGVALSNYRHFHLAEERIFEAARVGAAITTVDVAQSARHEARNHLQNCIESLVVLKGVATGGTVKEKNEVRALIDEISQELTDVENALQKIKTITQVPEREKVLVKIEDVWREAFGLVIGRLGQNEIRTTIHGSATAKVAKDYMRHAFLNLILNSVDAFKISRRKKDKRIDVTIDPQSEKAKEFSIRYIDNATGIDPSQLKPNPAEGVRQVNDIFLPGVSSKKDGSGYGMYLVRKILADHHGSIDLVDYRSGVVFQITLPKGA